MKRVYLATVFSAPDVESVSARNRVELERYEKVTEAAAKLMANSANMTGKPTINIFSPITHSYPFVQHISDRLNTHTFWLGIDFDWIDVCDELWVYCQDGWEKSYGVGEEIKYAKMKGMPIKYIDSQLKWRETP